jgi:hypothetical protein
MRGPAVAEDDVRLPVRRIGKLHAAEARPTIVCLPVEMEWVVTASDRYPALSLFGV